MQFYFDNTTIPPIIPEKDGKQFKNAAERWLCNQPFIPLSSAKDEHGKIYRKVRDHCHLTGKLRVTEHNTCNKNAKQPNFVPVAFHNLSG